MKKKLFAVSVAAVLVLSVALFAGCSADKPVEEKATVNQAQVRSITLEVEKYIIFW